MLDGVGWIFCVSHRLIDIVTFEGLRDEHENEWNQMVVVLGKFSSLLTGGCACC